MWVMRYMLVLTASVAIGIAVLGLCPSGQAADQQIAGLRHSVVASGQGYFPVALLLQDGRIAVVMRGGAPHLGIGGRLDIVFSGDQGKTWSKPEVVVDTPADDRNPAFGQARDGTLVVAFWRTARYNADGNYDDKLDKPVDTWVTRSKDAGKTWDAPQQLDVTDIGWGSPYGRILTMPDGAMLMSIYGGPVRKPGEPVNDAENNSYLYRSVDNGQTWKRFARPGAKHFNETAVVRLTSGKLVAAMRSDPAGDVWLADSTDGGQTWGEPKKLTPRGVHPADLALLADGRLLLVTGYRVGPFGICGVLGDAKGSFDWDRHFMLVDDAADGDCGYPSSVILKDGQALVVYYAAARKGRPATPAQCGAVQFQLPEKP
jgi:hypothetical protein